MSDTNNANNNQDVLIEDKGLPPIEKSFPMPPVKQPPEEKSETESNQQQLDDNELNGS